MSAAIALRGGFAGAPAVRDKVSGVHTLITGLNGHGKTLFLVSEYLLGLVGSVVEREDGPPVERRICQSGIKGLALPHEVIDGPSTDPEKFVDEWAKQEREPGEPPLADVHRMVQNWWAWCEPGDVIVIDEAQRVFRPMASGRRLPKFIEKLETARHYGVQFIYVTQYPGTLHANVRALVGPHQHIRRVFGGTSTIVVTWDRVNTSLNYLAGTKRVWRHDKRAFGLYKSAELHTQFKQRLPLAVAGLAIGVVVCAGLVYYATSRYGQSGQAQPATAKPGQGSLLPGSGAPWQGQVRSKVLEVSAPVKQREPFAGLGIHTAGTWEVEGKTRGLFTLSVDGKAVATISDRDVQRAGYAWRVYGPCSGVLIYGERERFVTCDAPVQPVAQGRAPAPAASAPLPALL